MSDILIQVLCLLGCLSVLIAAVGVLRFPDFFTRTHAATKASAFGLGVMLIAMCIAFPSWSMVLKCVFVIIALFLTLPVGSQALADAARDEGDDGEHPDLKSNNTPNP